MWVQIFGQHFLFRNQGRRGTTPPASAQKQKRKPDVEFVVLLAPPVEFVGHPVHLETRQQNIVKIDPPQTNLRTNITDKKLGISIIKDQWAGHKFCSAFPIKKKNSRLKTRDSGAQNQRAPVLTRFVRVHVKPTEQTTLSSAGTEHGGELTGTTQLLCLMHFKSFPQNQSTNNCLPQTSEHTQKRFHHSRINCVMPF